MREIHDLTPHFALSNDIGGRGWSNGSLTMEATDIEALYRSNLYLNVLTTGRDGGNGLDGDGLRCRIMSHLLTPAQELTTSPILMIQNPPSHQVTSAVTGIAWTNVDSTCRINYAVRLEGLKDQNVDSQLILKDYPIR